MFTSCPLQSQVAPGEVLTQTETTGGLSATRLYVHKKTAASLLGTGFRGSGGPGSVI